MSVEHNVLVMQFPDSSSAFQALSEIKSQPGLAGAAVVERTAGGEVRVAEGYSNEAGTGPAVGGLVGALVGVLAGPVGVLLGWSTGLLAGGAFELDEAADVDDGFTILSRSIPPGSNALFAEMTETSNAIADDLAEKLNGTVTRIPASQVESEVLAAREVARKAASEARRARREQRRDEFKDKLSSLKPHANA